MAARYYAVLRKDTDSDFGVSFPDLPGCVTAGKSLEEAHAVATDALAFHLEGLAKDRAEIPAPSSLDDIMADPESRDGIGVLVNAPLPTRAVRVNVTLPEDLLAAIDEAAGPGQRSSFLAEAAKGKLTAATAGAATSKTVKRKR